MCISYTFTHSLACTCTNTLSFSRSHIDTVTYLNTSMFIRSLTHTHASACIHAHFRPHIDTYAFMHLDTCALEYVCVCVYKHRYLLARARSLACLLGTHANSIISFSRYFSIIIRLRCGKIIFDDPIFRRHCILYEDAIFRWLK